jgi:hypothetical protein
LNLDGHTRIPNAVLLRKGFEPGPRATLDLLACMAREGVCWPAEDTLAELLGCGVRSVRRYVAALEHDGLVHVTARGKGRTNLYRLTLSGQIGRSAPPTGPPPDRQIWPVNGSRPAKSGLRPASFAPSGGQKRPVERPKPAPEPDVTNQTNEPHQGTKDSTRMEELGLNRKEKSTEELAEGFRAKRALQAANHAARLRVSGLATT